MNRRDFLFTTAASLAALALPSSTVGGAPAEMKPAQPRIPRWRGFNLPGSPRHGAKYSERDFAWMAGWGFDFARLPLSYWAWSKPKPDEWLKIDETAFAPVDEAVAFGRQYGIHINLNLHRIPGYCVNGRELEPFLLFDSPRDSMDRALAAAVHHWRFLAQRYKNIPSPQLSFDLLNEPPWMPDQSRYVEVVRALVAAIREVSPDRLIVVDGADIGQTPVPGIVDLGLVQSTRGYLPKMVSHYTAT